MMIILQELGTQNEKKNYTGEEYYIIPTLKNIRYTKMRVCASTRVKKICRHDGIYHFGV